MLGRMRIASLRRQAEATAPRYASGMASLSVVVLLSGEIGLSRNRVWRTLAVALVAPLARQRVARCMACASAHDSMRLRSCSIARQLPSWSRPWSWLRPCAACVCVVVIASHCYGSVSLRCAVKLLNSAQFAGVGAVVHYGLFACRSLWYPFPAARLRPSWAQCCGIKPWSPCSVNRDRPFRAICVHSSMGFVLPPLIARGVLTMLRYDWCGARPLHVAWRATCLSEYTFFAPSCMLFGQ